MIEFSFSLDFHSCLNLFVRFHCVEIIMLFVLLTITYYSIHTTVINMIPYKPTTFLQPSTNLFEQTLICNLSIGHYEGNTSVIMHPRSASSSETLGKNATKSPLHTAGNLLGTAKVAQALMQHCDVLGILKYVAYLHALRPKVHFHPRDSRACAVVG